MRTQLRNFSLYAVIAFLFGSIAGLAQTSDDSIYWYGDYHQALQKAKETGKPIFLEFRCEA